MLFSKGVGAIVKERHIYFVVVVNEGIVLLLLSNLLESVILPHRTGG
jgi:hypothetical protein